jgi:hypothetical protein
MNNGEFTGEESIIINPFHGKRRVPARLNGMGMFPQNPASLLPAYVAPITGVIAQAMETVQAGPEVAATPQAAARDVIPVFDTRPVNSHDFYFNKLVQVTDNVDWTAQTAEFTFEVPSGKVLILRGLKYEFGTVYLTDVYYANQFAVNLTAVIGSANISDFTGNDCPQVINAYIPTYLVVDEGENIAFKVVRSSIAANQFKWDTMPYCTFDAYGTILPRTGEAANLLAGRRG